MSHGKNQQRKQHQKHLEKKREQARLHPASPTPKVESDSQLDAWFKRATFDPRRPGALASANMQRLLQQRKQLEAQIVLAYLQRLHDALIEAWFQKLERVEIEVAQILDVEPARVHAAIEREAGIAKTDEASPAEVAEMIAQAPAPQAKVICPLCDQEITLEDALHNIRRPIVQGKTMQVHNTCPEKKPNG